MLAIRTLSNCESPLRSENRRRDERVVSRIGDQFHHSLVLLCSSINGSRGELMFSLLVTLLARSAVSSTVVLVILALLTAVTSGRLSLQTNYDKEATVWAISSTKVYHCPGSRWYGKTEHGKYISECEAIRTGFRPAFGRGCGSECKH